MRFLLVVIPVLLALPARAANTEAKEREARTACLAGDAAKGVQLLSELFVTKKDPTFIYNSGRCLEQNLKYAEAIGKFQEYLRVGKKLSADDKADAEKHIVDCKALLAEQKQSEAAAVASVPTPAPAPIAVPAPAPAPQPAQAPVVQVSPPVERGSGSGLRMAGIVTTAVGAAAVGAGVVFNVKANSLVSDMKKLDNYSSGKESDQSTYKTLGWVGYGAGAACIAGGAILYVLGMRAETPESSVALVPAVGPSHAGIILRGAF